MRILLVLLIASLAFADGPLPNAKAIRVAECQATDIKNNIFISYPKGISVEDTSTVTEDRNIFDPSVSAAYTGAMVHGGTSMTATDPQFVSAIITVANDVKLLPNSPAIGAGSSLGSPHNQLLDPLGNTAPYSIYTPVDSWPIGAFGPPPPGSAIDGADTDGVISD